MRAGGSRWGWSLSATRDEGAATSEGRALRSGCLEDGLIFSLRREGSVLRFVPPASTTEDQIDEAAAILEKAIVEVCE